jgi:hypothetical protein
MNVRLHPPVRREQGYAFRSAGVSPAILRGPTKVKKAGKMPFDFAQDKPALLKPSGISCRSESVTADALAVRVAASSNPLLTLAVIPQTRENERRRTSSILELLWGLLDLRLGGGSS